VLLHYTESGSGPPLVLVHSTAADSRQWDEQRDLLGTTRRIITPDLRGYGESPLNEDTYSNALDVLHLLDHLGVETTGLVGSSGGGHVALQVASTAPERVTSLVLLCAAADGVERTADLLAIWEREGALIDSGDVEGAVEFNVTTWLGPEADEEAKSLLRTMQERALRVQLAVGDDVADEDLDVDLSRITAPTTVVSGAYDVDFFGHVARHLVAGIPSATHIELPWAGHLPNLERPGETAAIIAAAIGS
jgi:pimeloyl-ACP methyl ester carboxylesterase